MVKVPAFDAISYLVDRRFPGFNGLEIELSALATTKRRAALEDARRAQSINIGSFAPPPPEIVEPHVQTPDQARAIEEARRRLDQEKEAAKYRTQLLTESKEHIGGLVEAERKKQVEELAAANASEERGRFFNLPSASADFSHYCKLANWTLDEAVALSLGKHPEFVNWKSVSPFTNVSPFAREYEKRRDIARRALWAQQLFEPVMPSIFLPWAKKKYDPLPDELLKAALDNGISLTGWQELYEALASRSKEELASQAEQCRRHVHEISSLYRSEIADAYEKLTAAQSELDAVKLASQKSTDASEKPLLTRERENLQLMALFGAIRGYGYNPDSNRNTATVAIAHDFTDLNLSFSDDRVRDHLNAAKEYLPGDWRKRWKPKPYTGKA